MRISLWSTRIEFLWLCAKLWPKIHQRRKANNVFNIVANRRLFSHLRHYSKMHLVTRCFRFVSFRSIFTVFLEVLKKFVYTFNIATCGPRLQYFCMPRSLYWNFSGNGKLKFIVKGLIIFRMVFSDKDGTMKHYITYFNVTAAQEGLILKIRVDKMLHRWIFFITQK